MSEPGERLVGELLGSLPVFAGDLDRARRRYQENKADAYMEPPTPESFLIDLAFSAVQRYLVGGTAEAEQLRGLLAFIEDQLGRDPDDDALIGDAFAGCLPEPGDRGDEVLDWLGPKLHALRFEKLREEDAAAPDSTVQFLYRMADAVPSLRGRLDEHFQANRRRPSAHSFVSEVALEAPGLVASGRAHLVRPLLDFLEAEFGGDADVDNVIEASFVEMLPDPGTPGVEIETLLGPKLRAELERQRHWPD
ncbi:hypothetical protein E0H75_39955 [Kribbella capetownensis]|uniref:DUF7674 domain-containing protein n=1 Tax=Kribbella capetownensis TaxID=1572659 RepID=A0A4R0J4W4_9ACTN|nr:hypothetical protein [Kribbella capetownensis]TCC39158.1 hypothetical protein E0H75_39955 [Kribbella capetownensis]